jgi:plasmid stability protein
MPQLLVRDIESAVVKRLRRRAAAEGVSVEEAHRRVLRSALVGTAAGPEKNFIAYLRGIPPGKAIAFPRAAGLPRAVDV